VDLKSSGKIKWTSDRKELIYKLALGLFIAALMVARYFNNESTIEYLKGLNEAKRAEQAEESSVGEADADGGKRALNFTLRGRDGSDTEFSSLRGNIVFLVFWSPRDVKAVAGMEAEAGELTAKATEAAGGVPVKLLWVLTPAPGADTLPEDIMAVYAGLGGDAGGSVGRHFVDGEARLAQTCLAGTFPSTEVFDADGRLSDYQTGVPDAEGMRELAASAAEARD
jgi:hypothetical protein